MILNYFEEHGILVRKKESIERRNYILLPILSNLSLWLKMFLPILGWGFI